LFRFALKWLWKKIYEGIDTRQSDLAVVRAWARKGPLVYIPSHKSHIDYLVLNYILYGNNMHVPRVAAGQNLTFWPMGHIFRKCGAFFIRRTFKGAKLYAEVFSRYVKALLQEGHPIQFYIEGGRSRNGKLILPKTGFLSILLQAYKEGYCDDLIFVPTSVIYDRIIEKGSYLKELGGGKKESENFKQVIGARRFLKRRYGKIYIRFNKPFSLNDYIEKNPPIENEFHRDLAYHLADAINNVSLITPLSLISTAILTSHRKGFYTAELTGTLNFFMTLVKRLNLPISSSLDDIEKAVEESIDLLSEWQIIEHAENPSEEEKFFFIKDDKKLELEYYKNSIIHFFIEYSFTAVSMLSGSEEEKSLDSIVFCHDLLKKTFGGEFLFDSSENTRGKVILIINYFLEEGLIRESVETGGYTISKAGFDKLSAWAALAKTFIESYWIAANVMNQGKDEKISGENLIKRIIDSGNKYYNSGVIDHIGAISRINFKNAVTYINREVLASEDNAGNKTQDYDRLAEFRKQLHELIN
ncbi:1-acyl-sn-glycerol-3-phosphate acyltransferase, partial [Thermodesulfobacteriota bacterium]